MLKSVRTLVVPTFAALVTASFFVLAGTPSASAGKPCKSEVNALADAEASCGKILNCAGKAPPQSVKCTGRTNRWICRCVKVKGGVDSHYDAHDDGRYDVFAWLELATVPER